MGLLALLQLDKDAARDAAPAAIHTRDRITVRAVLRISQICIELAAELLICLMLEAFCQLMGSAP